MLANWIRLISVKVWTRHLSDVYSSASGRGIKW